MVGVLEVVALSKTEYLYGEDAEVPEIPAEVVMRRIELLKDNLEELMKRCSDIEEAIDFWSRFLDGSER